MAKNNKKVVRSSTSTAESTPRGSTWKPSEEAKKRAVRFRIIAAVLWALAIGGEAYAIFGVLANAPVNMTLLIILIVAIGALAITANLLWRKANQMDPASEKNKLAFWVQNQLGAIITMIAFLPLIVLILINKDMSPKQKTIAAIVAAVVAIPAILTGVELNSNSVEQMTAEESYIVALTGKDEVFWTNSGRVYHLCREADYVNRDSADGEIIVGTIAQANDEGRRAPSDQTIRAQANQCGFEYFSLEDFQQGLVDGTVQLDGDGDDDVDGDAPADDEVDGEPVEDDGSDE